MGVADQRRYGTAFRPLAGFEHGARELSALAERVAELTRTGLTSGALAPGAPSETGSHDRPASGE